MAAFKEGQGIQTHRDDDFCTKIADGLSGPTATRKASVVREGDTIAAATNDSGFPLIAKKPDGSACIPKADADCNLITAPAEGAGSEVCPVRRIHAAVAASATDNKDQVITTGKKVKSVTVTLSTSGCFRFNVGIFDGTSTFDVYHTLWIQPAKGSFVGTLCLPETTGDGSIAVRVAAINEDTNANDANSTVFFIERD